MEVMMGIAVRNGIYQQAEKVPVRRPPHSPGSSSSSCPGQATPLKTRMRPICEGIPVKPPPGNIVMAPPAGFGPTAAKSPPARRVEANGRSAEFTELLKNQESNRAEITQWMMEQRQQTDGARA
eukprot:288797-Pyramimonas_sp.AAC.1